MKHRRSSIRETAGRVYTVCTECRHTVNRKHIICQHCGFPLPEHQTITTLRAWQDGFMVTRDGAVNPYSEDDAPCAKIWDLACLYRLKTSSDFLENCAAEGRELQIKAQYEMNEAKTKYDLRLAELQTAHKKQADEMKAAFEKTLRDIEKTIADMKMRENREAETAALEKAKQEAEDKDHARRRR